MIFILENKISLQDYQVEWHVLIWFIPTSNVPRVIEYKTNLHFSKWGTANNMLGTALGSRRWVRFHMSSSSGATTVYCGSKKEMSEDFHNESLRVIIVREKKALHNCLMDFSLDWIFKSLLLNKIQQAAYWCDPHMHHDTFWSFTTSLLTVNVSVYFFKDCMK